MTALALASNGEPLALIEAIAESGEGTVWTTDRPDLVAKIYHAPDGTRARKVAAMIADPPVDPTVVKGHVSIAWPRDLLRDGARTVGFVMPRVAEALGLEDVCNPKLRRRKAPNFNWHYLHVAALNVAWVVQAIHAKGYVIGDLKTDNLLVDHRALVSIIDTDSFHIRDRVTGALYRCPVGTEGFTAPELIGRDLGVTDRGEPQDRFGLAVILFLLLFGHHPHDGEWTEEGEPPSRDDAIRQGLWPQGPTPGGFRPGRFALPLNVLHPAIEEAFRRAFGPGHANPRARPTAEEWYRALRTGLEDLLPCSREIGHFHASRGSCPWCARARQFGADVFETPSDLAIEPGILAMHLDRALELGDERRALALWSRWGGEKDPGRDAAMAEVGRRVAALDRFLVAWRMNPDDDLGLLTLWQGPPDLARCGAARHETLGGENVLSIGRRLIEGHAALDRLAAAIDLAHADAEGYWTEAGEAALVHVFEHAAGLVSPRTLATLPRIERAEEARRRVGAFARLAAAIAVDDDRAIAEAWDQGRLLGHYAPARPLGERVAIAAHRVAALAAFERHARRHPEDDLGLWSLWIREPTLARSPLAQEPCEALGRIEPIVWAATAEKRVAIFHGLAKAFAADPPDNDAVAALWDENLCRGRPCFRAFEAGVERALSRVDRLARLKAAIAARSDSAIVAAWDERSFGAQAAAQPLLAAVREATIRLRLSGPAPTAAKVGALRLEQGALRLAWVWPEGIEACAVALREGRFPADYEDVEAPVHRLYVRRVSGAARAEIGLAFPGVAPHVAVWPAAWVGGGPVIGKNALGLALRGRIPIAYRLDGAGQLIVEAPDGAELPTLHVIAAKGEVPIPGDTAAVVLARLPGAIAHGPATIALPPVGEDECFIRLYPEDLAHLPALALRHPAFEESRLVPQ